MAIQVTRNTRTGYFVHPGGTEHEFENGEWKLSLSRVQAEGSVLLVREGGCLIYGYNNVRWEAAPDKPGWVRVVPGSGAVMSPEELAKWEMYPARYCTYKAQRR